MKKTISMLLLLVTLVSTNAIPASSADQENHTACYADEILSMADEMNPARDNARGLFLDCDNDGIKEMIIFRSCNGRSGWGYYYSIFDIEGEREIARIDDGYVFTPAGGSTGSLSVCLRDDCYILRVLNHVKDHYGSVSYEKVVDLSDYSIIVEIADGLEYPNGIPDEYNGIKIHRINGEDCDEETFHAKVQEIRGTAEPVVVFDSTFSRGMTLDDLLAYLGG